MINNLYIENIAVIEKTNIDFTQGLNVLTGETGAGKSIVIDAISAVLGRRTSRELVRTGAESAFVSARFSDLGDAALSTLTDLGYTLEDNELLVEREFTLAGKNNCRINGRPAAVSTLREIGRYLINIHGQHESYELMSPDLHIGYIDALGNLSEDLAEYRTHFAEYRELCRILSQKDSDDRDRAHRADLLRYQIEEISAAELKSGEEEMLSEQRNVLSNSGRLRELLSAASYFLSGDSGELPAALSLVSDAADNTATAAELMPSLADTAQRLSSVYYELQDISSELSSDCDDIEDDPALLQEIELRLDLISNLKKKYGNSIDEILEYLQSITSELDAIERFEEDRDKLYFKQQEALAVCMSLASDISEKRRRVAGEFSEQVAEQMHLLDMPSALLEVSQINCNLNENGCDEVEFLVSTNAGEPPKPVAKVASGGELSRMMLAIKTVLTRSDPTDTLIFDEVDSGISGSAARRVGDALKLVSKSAQTICVTHLPQIAALADSHYLIRKTEQQGRTYTEVTPLDTEGRVQELARIMGGVDVGDKAYDYARELLSEV